MAYQDAWTRMGTWDFSALGGAGVTQDQNGTTWKNGRLKEVGFFRLVGTKYVIPVAPRSMSVERLSLGISDT